MQGFALRLARAPKARLFALRDKIRLLSDGSPRAWIQVTLQGQWSGHHAGKFSFDSKTVGQIVHNFGKQENPIPLLFGHPDYQADGQPVPASGWATELEMRSDGELWALAEFTERAAEMVRAGELKFTSAVIDFNSKCRITGEPVGAELLEIGLVNRPFIDGMKPMELSRHALAGAKSMTDVELMTEALATLGDDATLDALTGWVEAKKALLAAEEGEAAPAAEGEPAALGEVTDETALAAPAPAVALEDGVSSPAGLEPEAEVAAPMAGADVLTAAGEQVGMDLTQVIAALQERLDDFVTWLGGTPVDGTEALPGEEAAADAAMLSRAQSKDLRVALEASKEMLVKSQAEIIKLTASTLGRDVNDAIEAGKIGDAEGALLLKLTATQPSTVTDRLAEVADAAPIAPTSPAIEGNGKGNKVVELADVNSVEFQTYEMSLRGSIKNKEARFSRVRELMDSREERNEKRRASRRR